MKNNILNRPSPYKYLNSISVTANRPPDSNNKYWSWVVRYEESPGHKISKSLGRLPDNEDEIRKVLRKKLAYVGKATPVKLKKEPKTIKDLLNWWLSLSINPRYRLKTKYPIKEISKSTYDNCVYSAKRVVKVGGKYLLESISSQDIKKIQSKLSQTYSINTCHLAMRILKQAIDWYLKWQSSSSYETRLKRLVFDFRKSTVRKEKVLQLGEPAKIIPYIKDPLLKLAYYIAWKTGARVGEIENLRKEDIFEDSENERYYVAVTGKTGKRDIPISSQTYQQIRKWLPRRKSIFKRGLGNATTKLKGILKKNNLTIHTFHDLRRHRSDELLSQPKIRPNPEVYRAVMGHSISTASKYYRRVGDNEKDTAMKPHM